MEAEDSFEKDIDYHITELETSSTLYAYQMRCVDQGEELSGLGRYEIDCVHLTGRLETQMSVQGQTLEISVDIVGRRLGDC